MKAVLSACTVLLFLAACSGTAPCCPAKSNHSQTADQESKLKDVKADKKKVPAPAAKAGEILVKFKPGTGEKRIREIARKEGLEIIKTVTPPSLYLLKSRETSLSVDKRIADLKKYEEVEYAEPNYIAKPVRN